MTFHRKYPKMVTALIAGVAGAIASANIDWPTILCRLLCGN